MARSRNNFIMLFVMVVSLVACGGGADGGNSSEHPSPFNDLTVTFDGTGTGSVNLSPVGVDCSSKCVETFANNSDVVLSATPDNGNTFVDWSGDEDCSDGDVIMNVAVNCTAIFDLDPVAPIFNLTVVTIGEGKVASPAPGFDCDSTSGPVCTRKYTEGSSVILSAIPVNTTNNANRFVSWTGTDPACNASVTVADSTVTMPANSITCRATFEPIPVPFKLTINVVGSGTVTSTEPVPVFNCGGTNTACSQSYAAGTPVVLTAKEDTLYRFVSWTGDTACTASVAGNVATITLPTIDVNCTAKFELIPKPVNLTIAFAGTGGGNVTLKPVGNPSVPCVSPTTCINGYDGSVPQQVTMTAKQNAGSGPVVWSGDTDCTDGVVMMSTSVNCIATFNQIIIPEFEITLLKSGTGAGTVSTSANVAGKACATPAANCFSYPVGTSVSLGANPISPGNTFDGWGVDTRSHADCANGNVNQSVQGSITCYATFTATVVTNKLTVSLAGNGKVNINTTPPLTTAGVDCTTTGAFDCVGNFSTGTSVVLKAIPTTGNHFVSWSGGAGCNGLTSPTITFVMPAAALSCTATFAPLYSLIVNIGPTAADGKVTSTTPAPVINCGMNNTSCTQEYPNTTSIVLTATPAAGNRFVGWSLGCSGTGAGTSTGQSTVTIASGNATCAATFEAIPVTTPISFDIIIGGTGGGSVGAVVAPSSATATCASGTCTNSFAADSQAVTLTATQDATSTFTGWINCGAASGTNTNPLAIDLAASQACTATFTRTLFPVTLTVTGTGIVTSTTGLNCGVAGTTVGNVCTLNYAPNTTIILTAGSTSVFTVAWSNGCTMDIQDATKAVVTTPKPGATVNCTATFTP